MNEIEELEDILDAILRGVQDVLQSGEQLPEDFQRQIAEEINFLTTEIDQLYAQQDQNPPGEPPIRPEIPNGTDLLWVLAGGDVNAFVNYLRTYPGQGLRELAANPGHLENVIAYLQQNNPIQPQESPDGIPNTMYHSSNVIGMKYDPRSKQLLVKFFGNGKPDPVYQYQNVPQQIFQILEHGNAFAQTKGRNRRGAWWPMKNPSIGAAVNQYLKSGGYPYQRVN